jgi:hypothetical protein
MGWRRSARAHLWEEEREQGSEPGWASHDPHHHILVCPHDLIPARPEGRRPRREAGGEAEDGGGAATSAREVVEDEDVVEAGVWRPRVSSSRVRALRTCRKVGVGRWRVINVRRAS